MSVPNQKALTIVKPPMTAPFLQINELDWQEAFMSLKPTTFAVYLYLAQNANGYNFEYSPQAIANTGLMAKGTASKARQELEEKGYIEDNCFYVQSKSRRQLHQEVQDEINKMAGG